MFSALTAVGTLSVLSLPPLLANSSALTSLPGLVLWPLMLRLLLLPSPLLLRRVFTEALPPFAPSPLLLRRLLLGEETVVEAGEIAPDEVELASVVLVLAMLV